MATIIEDFWVNLVEGTDEDDDVTINGGANTVDLTQGGNDILRVNSWIDTIEMGNGDDRVIFNTGSGANRIDLGNGVNTFSSAYGSPDNEGGYVSEITAGKGDHSFTVGAAGVGSIEIANKASSTSTFLGYVGEFIGGNQADNIVVTGGTNAGDFDLRRGDDNINSSSYFNSIDAGRGDDSVVVGGAGDVDLGAGDDFFSSSSGGTWVGRVDGGNGQDTIILGAGGTAYGGKGEDILIEGFGNDSLFGEGGNDTFVTNSVTNDAFDFFDGGSGNKDRLIIDALSEKEKLALEAELADFESGEEFFISSLNLRIENIEVIEIRTPDLGEF